MIATAMVFTAALTAGAQECATMPLLGRRVAVGADVSHSSVGETGFAASITGRVADRVRLSGAYQATRLDDVDDLAHEGRLTVSAPVGLGRYDVCPSAGLGYRRLMTEQSSTQGRVTTREAFIGASIGRAFSAGRGSHVTPFIEPLLVHRSVTWESIESWLITGDKERDEVQLWFGASLTTPRGAVIGRLRPVGGTRELSLGFVTGVGRR
jgi:hypothetical protein